MKESSDQVKSAVLCLGKQLSIEHETEILIKTTGLHSTIRTLVFKAFIENIIETTEDYNAIQILRKYCEEMEINGEVKFNE